MPRQLNIRRYRKLYTMLKRESQAQQRTCWLCGQPIDYEAGPDSPDSFSADHIHPVSTHPELGLVYSNLAPSHLACNKSRQDRMPKPGLGEAGGQW